MCAIMRLCLTGCDDGVQNGSLTIFLAILGIDVTIKKMHEWLII